MAAGLVINQYHKFLPISSDSLHMKRLMTWQIMDDFELLMSVAGYRNSSVDIQQFLSMVSDMQPSAITTNHLHTIQ